MRARRGDCVRARTHVCESQTVTELNCVVQNFPPKRFIPIQEAASGGCLIRYKLQNEEEVTMVTTSGKHALLVLVLKGNFLVEPGRRSKSVCQLAASVHHGVLLGHSVSGVLAIVTGVCDDVTAEELP